MEASALTQSHIHQINKLCLGDKSASHATKIGLCEVGQARESTFRDWCQIGRVLSTSRRSLNMSTILFFEIGDTP